MPKFEITWEAPEFEYRAKDVSWYWLSIIVAALIVAFSVWQRNFLFGFFVIVAEVLFIVWGNKVPHMTTFTLTDTDLNIGGYKTYLLKELESWSTEGDGTEWADVMFYFRSRIHPPITVIVPEGKVAEVRTSLKGILKEIEHEPTLIDSIEKFIRF